MRLSDTFEMNWLLRGVMVLRGEPWACMEFSDTYEMSNERVC